MSCEKLYCWAALRLTITCGVGGVTALLRGVCCLRFEFGVKCDDVVCRVSICCAAVFCTLGGATFSTVSEGESQLSIFVVWRPQRYRPNVSMLMFVHRRPYKMGLMAAGVTGHE
jgi:hypothetical protein